MQWIVVVSGMDRVRCVDEWLVLLRADHMAQHIAFFWLWGGVLRGVAVELPVHWCRKGSYLAMKI